MEEKERQRLRAVFDGLRQWIQDMETLRNVEGIETPEMEDSLRRGRKKLEKLGKRLGLIERIGLPWFQFYELIENSMYEFLPEKYQDYHVRIETVMVNGRQEDVLCLWKEGRKKLPGMPIGEYTDRVGDGADPWRMMGKMAQDYKKLICPEKKHQRER